MSASSCPAVTRSPKSTSVFSHSPSTCAPTVAWSLANNVPMTDKVRSSGMVSTGATTTGTAASPRGPLGPVGVLEQDARAAAKIMQRHTLSGCAFLRSKSLFIRTLLQQIRHGVGRVGLVRRVRLVRNRWLGRERSRRRNAFAPPQHFRSEEHTSELQSPYVISY